MKPYPAYKDSGVEWLGMVPEGWEVAKLGRHSRSGMGQTILKEMVTDEPTLDALPVFSASEGDTEFGYLTKPAICLQNGDLIVGARGSIGMVRYVSEPSTCTQTTIWLKLDRTFLDDRFTYWALRGGREALFPYDKTAIPMLTVEQVRAGRVSVPPLPEQQAIAAFLDRETAKIDGLIEEQRRLIALLAEKRQATISHAVIRGLNPSAHLKPSGVDWLGDVPEGWEVVPLKHVAKVQTGIAKGKDVLPELAVEVPYLRVANVQDGYIDLTNVASITIDAQQVDRYLLQPGDVLMNEGGDFDKLGRGAIWHAEISPCIHQNHVFAVRPQRVSSKWLSTVIGSDYAKFFFMGRSKQSTNLASISSTNLMELPVVMPPDGEQREILAELKKVTTAIDALGAAAAEGISLLQERRAALISSAVTGKIDVRAAQAKPLKFKQTLSVNVLLGGVIIAALGRHASMGRMLVQKHLFMAEAHAGVSELQGSYDRQAAGPYDVALQRRVEADLVAAGLLRVAQTGGPGSRVEYEFLGDAVALRADLAVALGDRMARFDYLTEHLSALSKAGTEAVATLYAAWNDFLIDGRSPSRDDIIREVLENWHDEKRDKFTKADLVIWLDWMDRHNIVPNGTGPKTRTGRLFL